MVEFGGWDMPCSTLPGLSASICAHAHTRASSTFRTWARSMCAELTRCFVIDWYQRCGEAGGWTGTVLCNNDAGRYRHRRFARLSLCRRSPAVGRDAGTTEKDWDWISSHRGDENVELHNVSADYCQIAVQVPMRFRFCSSY